MDLINIWIPLIGGGILWAIAIGAWFAERKIAGIWFGFAGTVLLLLLLVLHLQEGVLEATSHEKAPRPNAIDVARARAYVSVNQFVWEPYIDPGTKEFVGWIFFCLWQNTGETPTRRERGFTAFKAFFPPFSADPEFPDAEQEGGAALSSIARGGMGRVGGNYVDIDHVKAALDHKAQIFVWGVFNYDDVVGSGERHRCEFKAQVFPNPEALNPTAAKPFIVRQHSSGNSCD